MKKKNNIMFIFEIISVVIGVILIPFSVNKIMYALGFGLFFAGGMGLIMRLIKKSKNVYSYKREM